MQIAGATVLITGSSRGIGREFARQTRDRGAAKVYATARRPEAIGLAKVEPLRLDVRDPASVTAAAERAPDVSLLINNAGISSVQPLIAGDLDSIRAELDVHLWGTLSTTRAFAPILGANGGGAVLNVMSVLAFHAVATTGGYSVAESAKWALTNGIRLELAAQGTQVTAAHFGAVDTEMVRQFDIPKSKPADIVRRCLDAVEAGQAEVLADEQTRIIKSKLAMPPEVGYSAEWTYRPTR